MPYKLASQTKEGQKQLLLLDKSERTVVSGDTCKSHRQFAVWIVKRDVRDI
jgi:hypothetical protein